MKRILFLLATLLSLLFSRAQSGLPPNYYCVSSGVNNGLLHPSVSLKLLFIYNQAEIAGMTAPVTGPTTISRIYFRTNNAGTANYTGMTIRMGHTSLTNATTSTTFATNFNVGAPVTVYSGNPSFVMSGSNMSCATASTWFYLDLATPFSYNFVNNLCVEISYTSQSGAIPSFYALNPGGGANPTAITAATSGAATGSINARPMFGISTTVLDGESLLLELQERPTPTLVWQAPDQAYSRFQLLLEGADGSQTTQAVASTGSLEVSHAHRGTLRAQLRATDANGSEIASNWVDWLNPGQIKVWPQPWTEGLHVELPAQGCQLWLCNLQGERVTERCVEGWECVIADDLPPGAYLLVAQLPDGSRWSRKLLHL
jgi:hypothetical protein